MKIKKNVIYNCGGKVYSLILIKLCSIQNMTSINNVIQTQGSCYLNVFVTGFPMYYLSIKQLLFANGGILQACRYT